MSRTLKLLLFSTVAVSGLAVVGLFAWEWQKGLHPYLWTLYPVDEKTAEIKCLGIAFLGIYIWDAEDWRCAQISSPKETNQFSGILNDPNCELTNEYRVICSEPNKSLASFFEYLEQQ